MFTVALAFIGGYVKKALSNPLVIVAALVVMALICGRFWGKAACERKQAEQVVQETKVYIDRIIKIKDKYEGNQFDAETVLSGCVAESTKGQEHCL